LVTGWAWSYGLGMGDVYLVKLQDSVVPVELTNFNSAVNGDEVILSWTTATELNNSGFEVQRKSGTDEWFSIGFVQGAGTTQQSQNYSYTDKILIAGNYSYRLKQVDLDGSFKYSDAIEVEVNSFPARFSLEQNYPNPFNPSTKIRFTIPAVIASVAKQSQMVTLKVYNVLGNEIATLVNEEKSAGEYEVNFDASGLASGTYFYKLEAGSFSQVKKMILTK